MPRPAGSVLLETLIALLLLSLGLLAMSRTQTRLWGGVDLARQQGEALQLAQVDMESARHAVAADRTQWTALTGQAEATAPTDTRYLLSREVSPLSNPSLKTLSTQLRWQDREGQPHRLLLHTLLAPIDRRWSGWLALAPDAQGISRPQGRHAAVPNDARVLSDGRLAFKPRTDQPEVWVFDPGTSHIVGRCVAPVGLRNNSLQATDLSACTVMDARLLAGWIGYTGAATVLTSIDAERPSGPVLPAGLQLTLSSTGHPSPAFTCFSGATDEPHPDGSLPYWCLVQPAGTPAAWSGRLDLVPQGWTLAPDTSPEARRVCRYSADHNHNGLIDNLEHPAQYTGVQGPLPQQNFLVIAAGASCPLDGPPQHSVTGTVNAVDDSTVPHQP